MGKHCEGFEEPDPDSDGVIDETLPVEEEQPLAPVLAKKRTRYSIPYTLCRSKLKPSSSSELGARSGDLTFSARAENNCTNSAAQEEPRPPSGPNGGYGHPVSGTVLTAVKTGAYIDFIELHPRLKVKPETRGDVIPGTGDRKLKQVRPTTQASNHSTRGSWPRAFMKRS